MFNLFKEKKKQIDVHIDWKQISVDFHSHLLPCVDDGSQSIIDTVEILKSFINLGYSTIYTSPHIMGEHFLNSKSELIEKFNELKSHESIQTIDLKFHLIAEYLLDEQFEALLKANDFLTFSDNHILIETSLNLEFPFVRDYIFELIKNGYKPILAHPERYRYISNEKNYIDKYEELLDWGVEFQLNLFSLIGMYGDKTKQVAEDMIDRNLYSYVSSDIHSVQQIKFFKLLQKSIFLEKLIKSGSLKNVAIEN